MSGKIKLTENEKEIIKIIYPYLKDEKYDNVFQYISDYIADGHYGIVTGDITLNIINFLKESGINLLLNISEICSFAFYGSKALTSIQISGNAKEIGTYAFGKCTNLTEVKMKNGVEKICDKAFKNCALLNSIILPNSIEWIQDSVFSGCEKLETIDFSGTMKQWEKVEKHDRWNSGSPIRFIKCKNGTIELLS